MLNDLVEVFKGLDHASLKLGAGCLFVIIVVLPIMKIILIELQFVDILSRYQRLCPGAKGRNVGVCFSRTRESFLLDEGSPECRSPFPAF